MTLNNPIVTRPGQAAKAKADGKLRPAQRTSGEHPNGFPTVRVERLSAKPQEGRDPTQRGGSLSSSVASFSDVLNIR